MRKKVYLFLTVLLLTSLHAAAVPASLSIEDFSISAGETKEMLIDLNNPSDQITLVQFDMSLPAGLSIANLDDDVDIAGRTTYKKHSLDVNEVNGVVRFLLWSSSNSVLQGTSGAVISVKLQASSNFNGGNIVLKDILLVTPEQGETKPEDYVYTIAPPSIAVSGITLNQTSCEIYTGNTVQLTATVSPSNATNKSVTWSSSKTSVATVNSNGLVTGVAPGSAVITCTAQDGSGVKATCNITVTSQSSGDNIQFADAEVKRICVENWDTNGDGELSEDEAAAVTSIETVFEKSEISSFDEFRYFIGISVIPWDAFYDCESLTRIALPNSVTAIGQNAFNSCSQLTQITFPDNDGFSLGSNCFQWCSALTTITLPKNVISIANPFIQCHNLKNILVDSDNQHFKSVNGVVYTKDGKTIVVYPNGKELTEYTIIEGTTKIEQSAFSYSRKLTRIVIPSSVSIIGSSAFDECSQLSYLELPEGLEVIPNYMLAWTGKIENIKIPESVKSIGMYAFARCGLKKVELPSGIESIGEKAFYSDDMTEVRSNISNVFSINNNVFSEETFANATLYVSAGSKAAYQQADGWKNFQNIVEMGNEPGGNIIQFADAEVKRICVEHWDTNGDGELSKEEAAAVTSIGTIFRDNKNIVSFNELQYFTGLSAIDDWAFGMCSSLKTITFPFSLTSIGSLIFYGSGALTAITIPKSVTSIGDDMLEYTEGLGSIIVESGNTVYDSRNGCNAIIKTATNTLIAGCKNTTIPNSVASIGKKAFALCSNLASITIPSSVKSIGQYAFQQCVSLTSVTLPNSITRVEQGVFYGCSKLATVTIPNSVTVIGDRAFWGCALVNVELPLSLKTISSSAFYQCKQLTSMEIPEGVTSIGDYAFGFCDALSSISIPKSVSSIARYAFRFCPSLTEVTSYINPPYNITDDVFEVYDANYNIVFTSATLYVPAGTKTKYKAATGWKNFQNIVEMEGTEPELVLTNFKIDGNGIVGTKHTVSFTVRNDGGDFDGEIYLNWKASGNTGWNASSAISSLPANSQKNYEFEIVFKTAGTYRVWVNTDGDETQALTERNVTITPAATLTATSCSREYGEENPVFTFTADKGGFSGEPKLSTTATKYSDVGEYEIKIEQGTVDNQYVTLVPGKLTITKAPLTVYANNWYQWQGGKLEGFKPEYDGFKLNENESVLTKQPVYTTTATSNSPTGEYTLNVSGAEAKNYSFNYIPGVLTIMGRYGDVNRDGYINTTDIVEVVQYILGKPNGIPTVYDADFNRDNEINTSDLTVDINCVLYNDQSAARRNMPAAMGTLTENTESTENGDGSCAIGMSQDEQGNVAVSLQNSVPVVAFQFDVVAPEGADVSKVLLSDVRKNGHSMATNMMSDGALRVLAYSMQNNTLRGNDGLLATLQLNSLDGEVMLKNIHVADADGNDYALPDVSLNMLTGIFDVNFNANGSFDVYDLNGRLVRRNATTTKGLHRGVYMINNQKVIIK